MTIEAYSAVTVSDVSNNPIVSVDVLYNLSSSNTTPPSANDANWKTEADQWEDGKYFWQRTITTFKNGDVLKSDPVCITGGKGQTGVGIKSIKEQYYKSTSSSSTAGGSWISSPPEWEDGYYIWTRSEIIYSDDTTDYTSPILNQYYKSIIDKILNVESVVDKQEGIIKDKVSVTEFEEKIGVYDGKIETINTTVAEHTTSIGNITSQVNTLETTVSNNKTTMDEKIAKLELTDSNITSTVSNVKTQLDNLEVGGRNLIVQSKTSVGWVNDKGVVTGTGYMTSDYISVEPGDVIILQLWMPTSIRVWVDDTYFDSTKAFIGYYGGEYITTDHVVKEYIVPNGASYVRVSYSWASGYKVKLEKGTLPTDWTPAPEDTAEEISSVRTIAEQTADKFEWIVESGDSSTNFTLTDRTATLVANYINLNGLVTFNGLDDNTSGKINTASSNASTALINAAEAQLKADDAQSYAEGVNTIANDAKTKAESANTVIANWCYNNDVTYINGGDIYTGTITSKQLNTDAIKSNNYSYSSGKYSTSGTFLDLSNGAFTSKNFAIDSNGNAYFNGSINLGQISDWDTKESSINSSISTAQSNAISTAKTNSETYTNNQINNLADVAKTGRYEDLTGTPTIPTSVSQLGLDTSTIVFKGDVKQTTKTDSNGISYIETSVPSSTGSITYSTYNADDYIVFGRSKGTNSDGKNYVSVSKEGLLTARNALIYGTVYASNGEFTGTVTATAGEIGGCTIENGKLIVPIANISGSLSIGDITDLETQLSNLSENIEQAETNATNAAKSYTDGQITTVNETIDNVDDKADNAQSTADTANSKATNHYGTCTTASGTVSKVVTCSGFTLYKGATIWVKFANANSVANPTLNVNSTGAKSIYAYGSTLTATSAYNWVAGSTVLFVYNGTQWELTDSAGLSKANSAYSLANTANTKIGSWCATNDVTYIDGGKIYTGSVTADQIAANTITTSKIKANAITTSLLATDALKSTGYTNVDSDTRYSEVGTFFDLANGSITSKNFAIDSSGNAYFRGDVEATTLSALDEYRIYYSNYDIDGNLVGISDFSNPIMQGFYDDIMFEDDGLNNSMLYIGDNLNTDGCAKISFSTFIDKQTNAVTDTYVSIDSDYVSIASSGETTVNNLVAVSAYFHNDVEFNSNIICNSNIQGTLVGSMTIRGTNTISSESDTVSNWTSELVSWHYYNNTGTLASKPTTYGILQNMGKGSNTHQLWFGIPNGAIYHRSGNTNGWAGDSGDGSWKTILDSSNYTSVVDRLIADKHGVRMYKNGSGNYVFFPIISSNGTGADDKVYLGGSSSRWKNIYSTNGTIQTSDANEKHVVENISNSYEEMFMKLRPVTYMWRNLSRDNAHIHDRVHCGLIAQEVNEAAESVGLSSITFAAICRDDLDEPTFDGRTERWGINYSELHGIEIHMIQKTIKRQEKQDEEIAILKAQIIELSERLNKLEQKG